MDMFDWQPYPVQANLTPNSLVYSGVHWTIKTLSSRNNVDRVKFFNTIIMLSFNYFLTKPLNCKWLQFDIYGHVFNLNRDAIKLEQLHL